MFKNFVLILLFSCIVFTGCGTLESEPESDIQINHNTTVPNTVIADTNSYEITGSGKKYTSLTEFRSGKGRLVLVCVCKPNCTVCDYWLLTYCPELRTQAYVNNHNIDYYISHSASSFLYLQQVLNTCVDKNYLYPGKPLSLDAPYMFICRIKGEGKTSYLSADDIGEVFAIFASSKTSEKSIDKLMEYVDNM